jgi:hypothetical protein
LKALQAKPLAYDVTKLIRMCEELNTSWSTGSYLAVAMLARALLDHVPPIFNAATFAHVASNTRGAKSFRDSMEYLEKGARKIADSHLHVQIRPVESIPTPTQVNFSREIDVLLGEVVRLLKK